MTAVYQPTGGYGSGFVDRSGGVVSDAIMSTKHGIADLGQFFVTTNPTPGTALAYQIQTSFLDTAPILYLQNNDVVGGKRVYVDYIKIVVSVAAAAGVNAFYAITTDQAPRALSTDHRTALTPVNPNTGSVSTSILLVNGQSNATASAYAAAASPRVMARGSFGGLTVVGDELIIDFGADDITPYSGLTAAQATCPGRKVSSSPPLVLAPQTCATVALWFPSNSATGLSYELEIASWER